MLQLKKPPRLHRGDKAATVSLSWERGRLAGHPLAL